MINLSRKQIESISFGYLNTVISSNGDLSFRRYSKVISEEIYLDLMNLFYEKSLEDAGVRFDFYTNSKLINLKFYVGLMRFDFLDLDVFVDKKLFKEIYIQPLIDKEQSLGINLDGNEHRVTIFLGSFSGIKLHSFSIENGSYIKPYQYKKTALFMGDSITHGFGAKAMFNYVNQVCLYGNIDTLNQGIGGEIFRPEAVDFNIDRKFDYVFVALGSNDWHGVNEENLYKNADEFFKRVSQVHKDSKLFYLSPIYRFPKENDVRKNDVSFEKCVENFEEKAKKYNFVVIHGLDIVPHTKEFTYDGLHPNENGYTAMANGLLKSIKGCLDKHLQN